MTENNSQRDIAENMDGRLEVDAETEQASIEIAIERISTLMDADIILYNGSIDRPFDVIFIEKCVTRNRRTNAILILVTEGGDPDAAYRIGRCLQENYTKFTLFVSGYCKSAGTLIATGAHELIISDYGELGPLDVQMSKDDELMRTQSGLTVWETLDALKEQADDAFTEFFLNMQARSRGAITLRTATEIATKMTTGLLAPLYGQLDPMHVGEARRAMSIGSEYGKRLLSKGKNINEGELQYLTSEYAAHGFVSDRLEAEELFKNVREPTPEESLLVAGLGELAIAQRSRTSEPFVEFLSEEITSGDLESQNIQTEEYYDKSHENGQGETIKIDDAEVPRVASPEVKTEDNQNHAP